MKLLIHHHTQAYVDDKGIWLQSFIGSWICELSKYFNKIGLLIKVNDVKGKAHDFLINNQNVVVHNYGIQNCNSRKELNKKIINTCKEVSLEYDILLIRGITPKQKIVFDNCKINKKAFLLVGSITNSKPILKLNKISIIVWGLYWVRMNQLKKIAKASQVLANSKGIVDELFNLFQIKASFVPTNTISNTDFLPVKEKTISKPINILFCGRVREDKGIEELIKSLSIINNKQYSAKLDIVGDYSEHYKSKLKMLIAKLDLSSSVIFHGFVAFGNELFKFYKASDIYVLPSWHEGFPHSIWEAAANCTPVITTPVGGIPSVLGNKDVLFCKVKDPENIAKCIIQTFEYPIKTNARIKSLHSLAQNYSSEKCAQIMFNTISGNEG
jgi:glycosyltransferase involved in cell wall biosynthesis